MGDERLSDQSSDPHGAEPVLNLGAARVSASGVVVLIHGRGASAADMRPLLDAMAMPDLMGVAPQAAGGTWYPHSFMAALEQNQPYLDSALRKIQGVVDDLLSRGMPSDRIAILGFSQGACLASEFVARNPRRYGAVMALTGGLIGPPGLPPVYAGTLDGTPVFLGTSDPDPHVPLERVLATEAVFKRMGAKVELRRYMGMAHTINQDELNACRALLVKMTQAGGQATRGT